MQIGNVAKEQKIITICSEKLFHKIPGIYWFGNISTATGVSGLLIIPCTTDEINANI
jgi:hypothetical protein